MPRTGIESYYHQKIEELQFKIKNKGENLRRLQAQRNELNSRGTSWAPAPSNMVDPSHCME